MKQEVYKYILMARKTYPVNSDGENEYLYSTTTNMMLSCVNEEVYEVIVNKLKEESLIKYFVFDTFSELSKYVTTKCIPVNPKYFSSITDDIPEDVIFILKDESTPSALALVILEMAVIDNIISDENEVKEETEEKSRKMPSYEVDGNVITLHSNVNKTLH